MDSAESVKLFNDTAFLQSTDTSEVQHALDLFTNEHCVH